MPLMNVIEKCLRLVNARRCFEVSWNQCELLRAKSKQEFHNAKKNILLHYSCYVKSGAPKLTITIDVDIAPDPRK